MINFYIKNKKILNIILVIIFSVGFFGVARVCYADAAGAVATILGSIATIVVEVCGWLYNKIIGSIIDIASYNEFISNPQIKEAWVIIRDLCNMFFVLILLVIAFATILRIESYNVKKALPKLLIMAVLINFSRIIVGLLIDFSQVIMLTFVNAFADGGGNFENYLGISKFMKFVDENTKIWGKSGISLNDTVVAYVLVVLVMIIAIVTLLAVLIVFVMRMIMLWIYVVLSPLAFLLSAFPGGQKYASQYWGDLTKYLVNGPVLAFFIWLAFITLGNIKTFDWAITFQEAKIEGFRADHFMHFILAIGFLVGGLMISSQIGGIGANWGANTVKGLGSKAGGLAKKGALQVGYKLPVRGLDWAQRKISMSKLAEKAGVKGFDLAPTRLYKRITEGLEDEKRKDIDKMGSAAGISMKKGGFSGLLSSLSSPSFAKEVLDGPLAIRGIKRVWSGGADMYSNELDQASKHDVHAKTAQKMTEFIKKGYNNERLEREFKQGDEYKNLKSLVGEKGADEYFNKIKGLDKIALNKEIKERKEYAMDHRETAARYQIADAAGDKVFWNGIREAKSKTGEENEDAIAESFIGAVEKKDWELAGGLYLKACDVNGYNKLLERTGYSSVDAGFTKEEAERLKNGTDKEREDYERYKGGNDMFRDIFIDKLGMDEERALAVQAEGAEICLAKNHTYGAKTISIKNGKRVQNNADEQRQELITDVKKGDVEGYARKAQKAAYGGFDAYGKWQSNMFGQEIMLHSWRSILKQIDIGRWNPSAAEGMGKKEEVDKIRDLYNKMVATTGGDEEAVIKMFGTTKHNNKDVNIKQYFDIIEEYSHVGGEVMVKTIGAARKGEKFEIKKEPIDKSNNSKQNTDSSDKKSKTYAESSDEEQREQWDNIFRKK
jgi:hypothetical protein